MNPILSVDPAAAQPDLFLTLVKSFGMLAIVIAILVGVMYFMKRFTMFGAHPSGKSPIRMLSALNLGPRERVVLIEVEGKKILIGVTQQAVQFLTAIENPDSATAGPGEGKETGAGFSKIFRKAVDEVSAGDKKNDSPE